MSLSASQPEQRCDERKCEREHAQEQEEGQGLNLILNEQPGGRFIDGGLRLCVQKWETEKESGRER